MAIGGMIFKMVSEQFIFQMAMYEGHWKGGKKHGDGEFHFQSRAQILKGTWSEGISKCGELFEMKDKTKATNPFKYPIPKIELVDPRDVLAEAKSRVAK